MTTFKKGDIVFYGSEQAACVVLSAPFIMANGIEVCRLLGPNFYTGVCHAAFSSWMKHAPTLFRASDRTWHTHDDDGYFDAETCYVGGWVVAFLETANIVEGFDSYEDARAKIEELCK